MSKFTLLRGAVAVLRSSISALFRCLDKSALDAHVSAEPSQALIKQKEVIIKSLEIKVCIQFLLFTLSLHPRWFYGFFDFHICGFCQFHNEC